MSATEAPTIVTGVDFVSVPTQDLERAVEFYGTTLGLPRSMYKPERNFAEFETGTVTLSVVNPEQMGIGDVQAEREPPRAARGGRGRPPARRSRSAA